MANVKGKDLVKYAESKLKTPYVYAAKMETVTQDKIYSWAKLYPDVFTTAYITKAKKFIGKTACDCSGLISSFTGVNYGSAQLYANAKERHAIDKNKIDEIPVGSVLWREGHVGIATSNGYLIEERGIEYGTVKTKIKDRTFTHWLVMPYIEIEKNSTTTSKTTTKATNVYTKPTRTLKSGDIGNDVKWLQTELVESGYTIKIDGEFGGNTLNAVKKFQKSCKIGVDGIVGETTKAKLIDAK